MLGDRWKAAVPTGCAMSAVYEHGVGWSLTLHMGATTDRGPITERARYEGLTRDEMIAVVDCWLEDL